MSRPWILLAASIGAIAVLFFLLAKPDERSVGQHQGGAGNTQPLILYCAASNRAVMEKIRSDYEAEFDRPLQIQYGGSQTLLSSIEVNPDGDLYLPADDSYIKIGRKKDLLEESIPLATMHAVIAIPKGNPKSITSLSDLLRDEIRLVQASPDATAIGKVVKKEFEENGLWAKLDQATLSYKTTVNEVANDILVGAADAGIVFDAVLHTYSELEFIEVDELKPIFSTIEISVIKGTERPTQALHFARYLAARNRGLVRYKEFGFRPVSGDQWDEAPELSIFAGSMLRPAIDETITEFENREGVVVHRVYNGCGILVAQMKSGQMPDAYFACDREFMDQMSERFPKSTDVSQNELVILVQKGNPFDISSLRDLTKEGIRVGIGHEKQCAMGWLTQNTLREGGVQKEVMENVTMQTATGDLLVNQLKAGGLDAAVAYLSNAAGSADVLDAVRIHGLNCAVAIQPFAVALNSPNQRLAQRLLQRIQSEESQEIFRAEGFQWQSANE